MRLRETASRYCAAALASALAAVLSGCGPAAESPVPPLPVWSPAPAPSPADPRAHRVSVDFRQVPFAHACRLIERVTGVPVKIETAPGFSGRETVSLAVEEIPLPHVLDWLCRQVDAFYGFEEGEIWIARQMPRAFLSPLSTRGYSLHSVLSPPGGARVAEGVVTTTVVHDPARRLAIEEEDPVPPGASGPRAAASAARAEAREAFFALLSEALADVAARAPGARVTPGGKGFVATLPPRGHARVDAILEAFARGPESTFTPIPPDAPVSLERTVSIDVESADAETVLRRLARAAGVNVGFDARTVLAWTPRPIALRLDRAPLSAALAALARQTPWRHWRAEPAGVWLAVAPIDAAEPVSRAFVWDRCRVAGFPIPEAWLRRRTPAQIAEAVRMELSPAPTRGEGRFLGVHAPTALLVAALEPKTLARIPRVLEDFKAGLWPGMAEKGAARGAAE